MVTYSDSDLLARDLRIAKNKPDVAFVTKGVAMEGDLHKSIKEELKRRRWYYVWSRMDRPTTTQLGVTDFIIALPNGKTLWLECKRKGNKLSETQNIARHILLASGHWHSVVYNMEEFLTLIANQ